MKILIALATVLALAGGNAGILSSPTRVAQWSDAPDTVTLPADWAQTVSSLTAATARDRLEHAACLPLNGPPREIGDYGKGMLFEAALPACPASADAGSMHSHLAPPAFFSDADAASFIGDARHSPERTRLHIVANADDVTLFVSTAATNHDLASPEGRLIVPHVAAIDFSRAKDADKTDMVTCLFRTADIAVYTGPLPVLKKVQPREGFTLGPFTCHAAGITVDQSRFFRIIAAVRTVLHERETRGYVQRLDAAIARVVAGGDLNFIRAFSDLSVRDDPRVAVKSSDTGRYYPVGACEDHDVKSQTIELYPACTANYAFRTAHARCVDASEDRPVVGWFLADAGNPFMRITWAQAGDPAHCRALDYRVRDDGTRGPQIADGLVDPDG